MKLLSKDNINIVAASVIDEVSKYADEHNKKILESEEYQNFTLSDKKDLLDLYDAYKKLEEEQADIIVRIGETKDKILKEAGIERTRYWVGVETAIETITRQERDKKFKLMEKPNPNYVKMLALGLKEPDPQIAKDLVKQILMNEYEPQA
jgi:hypothetical protein